MQRLLFMLLAVTMLAPTVAVGETVPARKTRDDRAQVAKVLKLDRRLARQRGKQKGRMVGWPVPEDSLADPPARPSGDIHIYSINYKDEAQVNIYNPDGSYNIKALAELSHIFKCRRSGLEHDIDTRLLTILSHVYDHFGRRIELLSGYRFQRRTTSNHFHGAAADIRIAGIDPRKIRAFVETIDAGGVGVGYYPRVGFVHVDVREPPSYRWIDYSRSNPDSPGRMPPRGFHRRNPQS
ncbi:MAG: DUF882 domain-containing protein [Polyangia bacterium]|jgi:uncharacterized protein YcbK (DUF882 family)